MVTSDEIQKELFAESRRLIEESRMLIKISNKLVEQARILRKNPELYKIGVNLIPK